MHTSDTLALVELFQSLQGEGRRSGRATIFVRLAGCDLCCSWCDTDHEMRELVTVSDLVERVEQAGDARWVCVTGGEPGVQDQVLRKFVVRLHLAGYKVQVETNGLVVNLALTTMVDFVTVSPKLYLGKSVFPLIEATRGLPNGELKVVIDQNERPWFTDVVMGWQDGDCPLYLQPVSCSKEATERCIALVQKAAKENVRLSLQTQKILSIP